MTNVIEFKRPALIDESEVVRMEQFTIGATAMLMDVRTQLQMIGSALPTLEDITRESDIDRLLNITFDLFEKIVLPIEVPVVVNVFHKRANKKALSIAVSGHDLQRCKQAGEGNLSIPPNFRLDVAYQELEVGNLFERQLAYAKFDDLVNSPNNLVPRAALWVICERMIGFANINAGVTKLTEDKKLYIAYIPYSPKYTIVISLQGDLSEV